MNKKYFLLTIIVSVVLAVFLQLAFGTYLSALLSNFPPLQRLHIFSPQTPIVINKKEIIRQSDSGDVVSAVSQAKTEFSLLIALTDGQPQVIGGLINVSADGVFLGSSDFLPKDLSGFQVVLSDGRSALVTKQVTDPATGLVFLKAQINNVPVADFAQSKGANVGEKIVFLENSIISFNSHALVSSVTTAQDDSPGQVLNADLPRRSFGAQPLSQIALGEGIINLQGQVLGFWSGSRIVSADIIKQAMNIYFAGGKKIARPSFGFSYSLINKTQAALTNSLQGARVVQVSASSKKTEAVIFPAAAAGLAPGDLITSVDNNAIDETHPLEEILEKYKPGDVVKFNIVRGGKSLSLSLTVGSLQ